jgi:hypothetical protein
MDRNDDQIRAATDLGLAIVPYAHGRERRTFTFFYVTVELNRSILLVTNGHK